MDCLVDTLKTGFEKDLTRSAILNLCEKIFKFIGQFFIKVNYKIYDLLKKKSPYALTTCNNRPDPKTYLYVVKNFYSPIPVYAFAGLGIEKNVAICSNVALQWKKGLCVGMSLRFCKEILTNENQSNTLKEKTIQSAKSLKDGADLKSLILQSLYSSLLGSQTRYSQNDIDLVKNELLEKSSEEVLKKIQNQQESSQCGAFLSLVHNDDHLLRTSARQTMGEMYGCTLSEVNIHESDLTSTLSHLEIGTYMVFYNNHSFAFVRDSNSSFLFDADRGSFECNEINLNAVVSPIESKYVCKIKEDQRLTILKVEKSTN